MCLEKMYEFVYYDHTIQHDMLVKVAAKNDIEAYYVCQAYLKSRRGKLDTANLDIVPHKVSKSIQTGYDNLTAEDLEELKAYMIENELFDMEEIMEASNE